MKKRFKISKDEHDFTEPCKLTKQKRWTENPQELERYQHKALAKRKIICVLLLYVWL